MNERKVLVEGWTKYNIALFPCRRDWRNKTPLFPLEIPLTLVASAHISSRNFRSNCWDMMTWKMFPSRVKYALFSLPRSLPKVSQSTPFFTLAILFTPVLCILASFRGKIKKERVRLRILDKVEAEA